MDLKQELDRTFSLHPLFAPTHASDEEELLRTLKNSPMFVGSMELVYDRSPSYRTLLEYQASQFITIAGKDGNKIAASASFSWGRRWVSGALTNAMYVGDFRASFSRILTQEWREFYADFIKSFSASFIYTAILKENLIAQKNLVKKRRGKRFFYFPLAELTMVNVVLRLPKFRANPSRSLVDGEEVGENKLRDFLIETNRDVLLGYDFTDAPGNEWDRRKALWPNYELKNFLVLLDDRGSVIACTLPWSPGAAKRIELKKISRLLSLSFKGLRLLGAKAPRVGESIHTLYLTHLCFNSQLTASDRAEAISAFLDHLYDRKLSNFYQMISFADDRNLSNEPALRKFVMQKTGVHLYSVNHEDKAPALNPHQGIAFEMGLV